MFLWLFFSGSDYDFTESLLNGDLSNVLGDVRSHSSEARLRTYEVIMYM